MADVTQFGASKWSSGLKQAKVGTLLKIADRTREEVMYLSTSCKIARVVHHA